MKKFLIKNASLVDGTGSPSYIGSILIKDGRLAYVGPNLFSDDQALEIDAGGLYASPGFIDMHSHSSLAYLDKPDITAKINQGVTSEVIGVDGLSVYPIREDHVRGWRTHLSGLEGNPQVDWSWRSLTDYVEKMSGTGTNPIPLVGHGNVRLHVMGMEQRTATPKELDRMCGLLAECFEEGAWGLSTGLVYAPCTYSNQEEMYALGRVVAKYDRFFVFHMRHEGPKVLDCINEVAGIGKETGCKVHISHLKAMGKKAFGMAPRIIETIDNLRNSGIAMTADQYPYTAASTMMPVILPPWVHAAGPAGMKRLLSSTESLDRIEEEMKTGYDDWESFSAAAGWENIYVSSVATEKNQWVVGKSLVNIGEKKGLRPFEVAMKLMLEEDFAVGMVFFVMDENDVSEIMKAPWVMFCTDGLLGGRPHPRTFASYPHILVEYVRKRRTLALEDAIRKGTSLVAGTLELKGRGSLKEGFAADVCVFDLENLDQRANYDTPDVHPVGIKYVFNNGKPVIWDGSLAGNRPGRPLLRR